MNWRRATWPPSMRALAISLPLSGLLAPLTQATIKAKVSGVIQETTLQEASKWPTGKFSCVWMWSTCAPA